MFVDVSAHAMAQQEGCARRFPPLVFFFGRAARVLLILAFDSRGQEVWGLGVVAGFRFLQNSSLGCLGSSVPNENFLGDRAAPNFQRKSIRKLQIDMPKFLETF